MKLKGQKNQINYLRPINVEQLRQHVTDALADTPYWSLLLAIADALDTAVEGENTYLVIGTTKDVTAPSLTINQGPARQAVYADSLAELGEKANQFYEA